MYDQVETIATRLGIKQSNAPHLSQLWQCWADRVLEAEMHHHAFQDARTVEWRLARMRQRDTMIEAANAYTG